MRRRRSSGGQPRKLPSGPRGEAIFESILEACRRIIERDGYQALTSNGIAKEAGVSIGSFYQYFPESDAVVAEIARGLELRTHELARERLRDADGDLVAMVDGLVDILATDLLGELRTRSTLLQRIPRGWIHEASADVDGKVVDMVERALIEHRDRLPHVGDPAVSAFMLVTAVEAVVEACLERHPRWLETGALRQHLRELVLRYLGIDAGAARASKRSA